MADSKPVMPVKPAPGLLRSSALVGSMTMTSRVAGLVRDMVIASFVGASDNADAFLVAFKIPNFLRRLFAEGAFSQAFIPVLAEYKAAGSTAATKALIDHVAGERLVYRERAVKRYARRFTLPTDVDQAASQAKLDNGVLTLSLAKKRGAPVGSLAVQ